MLIPTGVSAEFFHTADGTGFVDLLIDGHRETWPVRSKRLRTWLRRRCYEATGAVPSAGALSSMLDLLEAIRRVLPELLKPAARLRGDQAVRELVG